MEPDDASGFEDQKYTENWRRTCQTQTSLGLKFQSGIQTLDVLGLKASDFGCEFEQIAMDKIKICVHNIKFYVDGWTC